MRRLAALLAIAIATPAAAQAPSAGAPATRQIKIDVSPAGQATLKKYLGARDPAIVRSAEQLRTLQQQMAALTNAPKLDLVRLRALMRQQEGIETGMRREANDRMLAMLGELSEADRIKFVRSFRPAQPPAAPPAGR